MGNTTTKESRPAAAATLSQGRSRSRRDGARSKDRKQPKVREGYQLIIDPSEMVDGGYLFPQGVYSSPQDFKVAVVRELIIGRRLAPFYKGLESVDPNWTDDQLLFVINAPPGTPAPPPAQNPDEVTAAISELAIEDGIENTPDASSSASPSPQPAAGEPASRQTTRSATSTASKPTHQPKSSAAVSKASSSHTLSRPRSHTTSVMQTSQTRADERNTQAVWLYRNVHECPI